MKKFLAMAAVAALAVAMLALPASAAETDVGVFTGTATVAEDAGPNGLHLPSATPHTGSWSLSTTVDTLLHGSGLTLNASGKLSPVAGVGAACGVSNGHSGTGSLTGGITLSDIGWVTSAGGTLPVTGHYVGSAATDSGPFVAVTQAQGGAACANAGGATSFTVVGAAAFL